MSNDCKVVKHFYDESYILMTEFILMVDFILMTDVSPKFSEKYVKHIKLIEKNAYTFAQIFQNKCQAEFSHC